MLPLGVIKRFLQPIWVCDIQQPNQEKTPHDDFRMPVLQNRRIGYETALARQWADNSLKQEELKLGEQTFIAEGIDAFNDILHNIREKSKQFIRRLL